MRRGPLATSTALAVVVLLGSAGGCGLLRQDHVHARWQDRPALPECGEVTLTTFDELEEPGFSGVECLREGMRSGEGGELIVRYLTDEGDPITDYRRVTSTGSTETYTDSTQDEFGEKGWSYGKCDQPDSVLDAVC